MSRSTFGIIGLETAIALTLEHLVQPGSQLLLPRIVEAGLEHRNELRPGAFVDEHHEAENPIAFRIRG